MSSIFSPVSEGFVVGSNKQECELSHSAKSTHSVTPCCTNTGLMSPSMPTSEGLTGTAIAEPSILSAEDTFQNRDFMP